MCMVRQMIPTPQMKAKAQARADAVAVSQHRAAKHALHTRKDPRTCFTARVATFGPPKVSMKPAQIAYWRSQLDPSDESALFVCAAECNYAIKATDLPVRESPPGTWRQDYDTILAHMDEARNQLWQIALTGEEEAVSKQWNVLDELREKAIASFPDESNIVFGSAMSGVMFYTVQGRPNALKNTCDITEDGFPGVDVVSLTTPVDAVQSGARGKGSGHQATRSSRSAAGGSMGGGEHSWPCPRPQVPVLCYPSGEKSFTVYGPAIVKRMRLCEQEMRHIAHELDAALQARGEEQEHVEALDITMQQVDACEQMYRAMEGAGKSWKENFRLVLPLEGDIMLDDGALSAFLQERVDSLVFKLMPPGSDASSGISYVAVLVGTEHAPPCISVPCMDKHLEDDEFPEMVHGPTGNICIFGPPGFIAKGELGGTSVQEETDMGRFVNPTLGAHLPELSALCTSTTMDTVNCKMYATVPGVTKPKMSMLDTKNFCSELFSGDIEHLVLTLVMVVCGEQYSNVKRNDDGMMANESFKIKLHPVQAHASTGTSRLFKDLVPEETGVASAFQNLVVVDDTHDSGRELFASACKSGFSVERASRSAVPVPLPQAQAQCFFSINDDNKLQEMGIVPPGGDDSNFCCNNHQSGLCRVLLNPQSAFRLPDGTMEQGLEGLRAALGVRTLGELMYLGIFQQTQVAHKIQVKQHDGKDDEIGEPVDMSQAQTGTCGSSPCLVLPVPSNMLLKVTIKAGINPIGYFRCIYLTETGEQEEEDYMDLKPGEEHEFPYPLQKEQTDEPDGLCVDLGNKGTLKIFFYAEKTMFQPSLWGNACDLLQRQKKRLKM